MAATTCHSHLEMWLYWRFATCFFLPRPPATAKRPETDHPGCIPDPRCGAVFTGGRAQSDHPRLSSTKIEPLDCPQRPGAPGRDRSLGEAGGTASTPRVTSRPGWDSTRPAGAARKLSQGPTRGRTGRGALRNGTPLCIALTGAHIIGPLGEAKLKESCSTTSLSSSCSAKTHLRASQSDQWGIVAFHAAARTSLTV